jgi:hypothetical protein
MIKRRDFITLLGGRATSMTAAKLRNLAARPGQTEPQPAAHSAIARWRNSPGSTHFRP